MYKKVKTYSQAYTENILYDFAMDYKDPSKLFCSEVIYLGYLDASKEQLSVPLYRTKFSEKLLPFLNQIGMRLNNNTIKTFDTFSPGDIEFDTRFDIVAEWRNPAKLKNSITKDAVLTKVFEWLEQGYKFVPSAGMKIKSAIGRGLRQTPYLKELVRADLSPNMTMTQIQTFLALEVVGESLQTEVERQERLMGKELSFKETLSLLEEIKSKDFENYTINMERKRRVRRGHQQSRRTHYKKLPLIFHNYFRPN